MAKKLHYKKLSTSARSPFCVEHEDDAWLHDLPKPRTASAGSRYSSITTNPLGSLGPLSPSSTKNSSPRSSAAMDPRSVEDEIIGSLAQSAMLRVRSMAHSAFYSVGWTERKATASELVFEQKTPSSFSIIAKALVPCTVDELSRVLSSTDADQLNASMLEICGAKYAFGVTVCTVPTSAPESHLSIKAISFSSANPLSSAKTTTTFLDYVEADTEQRTVCRVVHTLARTRDFAVSSRHSVLGDVLVGYVLQEEPETKQSMVFWYATHFNRSAGVFSMRPETVQWLRRMSQASATWAAIATRRRLGTHQIYDRTRSHTRPPSCRVCAHAFTRFALRRKHYCHLCDHFVCGGCSRIEEVEEHLGIVDKRRVCVGCRVSALMKAFERREGQEYRKSQGKETEEEEKATETRVPEAIQSGTQHRRWSVGSGERDDHDDDLGRGSCRHSGPLRRPYLIV